MWLSDFMRTLEKRGAPPFICEMTWNIIFPALYINYNADADLLPQFETNISVLKAALSSLASMVDAALREPEGGTDG